MVSAVDKARYLELWRQGLYLPHYRVSEAARYAELPARTIGYWFRGGKLGPMPYPPRGAGLSFWQLIEIALVSTFRNLGVPLGQIQKVRDYAAEVLESDRPFAEYEWMIQGPQVVSHLAKVKGHKEVKRLIDVDSDGPAGWAEAAAERFQQFDYEENLALVWHLRGRDNPVRINAHIRHGDPIVQGLPTWVLRERSRSGESLSRTADDFNLHPKSVRFAWEFEGVKFDPVQWCS